MQGSYGPLEFSTLFWNQEPLFFVIAVIIFHFCIFVKFTNKTEARLSFTTPILQMKLIKANSDQVFPVEETGTWNAWLIFIQWSFRVGSFPNSFNLSPDVFSRAYSRPFWMQLSHPIYCPEFWRKIFSLEMVKNSSCVGGFKQIKCPFFKKCAPRNAPMPPVSRISPV